MKYLLIILVLTACGRSTATYSTTPSNADIIYHDGMQILRKIKVDSTTYITTSDGGIIKHEN